MKITIDYLSLFDESFNPTIILEPQDDVRVLSQKLVELYGIPENQQLLRYKRDGLTLKLIPGWPLSHFCHEEEVVISLDIIGSPYCTGDFHLQLQQPNITQNYASDAASPRKMDLSYMQRSGSGDSSTSRNSSLFFNKTDTSSEGNTNSLSKMYSRQSDALGASRPIAHSCFVRSKPLIQAAKDGNLENLREYLKEIKERGNSQVGAFIDEPDHAGWNPLHWSAFRGQLSIVQDLVKEGADVNKKTKDEWTPLQLATYRNHIEIMRILLGAKDIEVNKVTAKASAIHIAAKTGNADSIRLLAQYGANLKLENDQGITPSDLTKDGKVHLLLSELISKAENENQEKNNIEIQRIVKGWMIKKSARLKILNLRYFILNFTEGTFTRYKRLEDVPHHPHEITFLTDIRGIRRKKPGFLDKKDLHYIELSCARRSILACYTAKIADEWVSYISQAITYTRSVVRSLHSDDRATGRANKQKCIEEIELHNSKGIGRTTIKEFCPTGAKVEQAKISIDDFSVIEEIGHGGFAKVFKVMKKSTGKYYALKAMRKQELMLKRSLKYAISEVNILKQLDSPFVLNLHFAFQTKQHLCLVVDYCAGGTLLSHLSARGVFTEDEARFFIAELILAIESLHDKDIIYRDLKPDNILIDDDGHIKLADFGLAREGVKNMSIAKSICGSPAYLAPEVVKGLGACKATDMYGIGIILYEMLVGAAPYFSTDLQEMYKNITSKKLEMPRRLSSNAKNLLEKLIVRDDPKKRIGIKNKSEIKKHPFFKGLDWGRLERKEIKPPMGFGEQSFATEESLLKPKSIELDRDDMNLDGIAHVANFSFVASGSEANLVRKLE